MTAPNKNRIIFLDYMRVFAFVSVLIGHKFFSYLTDLVNDASQHVTVRAIAEALIPLCQGGAAGVVVFFLTSGYIITHVLQKEVAADFVIKRIFRIYPLYIAAIFLEAAFKNLYSGVALPDLSVFIQRALLIGDFYATPYALDGVEWTLRIEIIFYAYMFSMKMIGAFNFQKYIPAIYMATAFILYMMPAFPGQGIWTQGYYNAYLPFLLAGSLLYLAQKRLASRLVCTFSLITLLFISMSVITNYQPVWKASHYAIFATAIFLIAIFSKTGLRTAKVCA